MSTRQDVPKECIEIENGASSDLDAMKDSSIFLSKENSSVFSCKKELMNLDFCEKDSVINDENAFDLSDAEKKSPVLDNNSVVRKKKPKGRKEMEPTERRRRITTNSMPSLANIIWAFQKPARSKASSSENLSNLSSKTFFKNSSAQNLPDQIKNVSANRDLAFNNKSKLTNSASEIDLSRRQKLRQHSSESDVQSRVSTLPQWFKYINPTSARKKLWIKPDRIEELHENEKPDRISPASFNPDARPASDSGMASAAVDDLKSSLSFFSEVKSQRAESETAPRAFVTKNFVQRDVDELKQKIRKISELISKERVVQEEDITEYMRLSLAADKQQAARLKAVFDRKKLKSKQLIDRLQKKLDMYESRLKNTEYTDDNRINENFDVDSNRRSAEDRSKSEEISFLYNACIDGTVDRNRNERNVKNNRPNQKDSLESLANVISTEVWQDTSNLLNSVSIQLQYLSHEIREIQNTQVAMQQELGIIKEEFETSSSCRVGEESFRREQLLSDLGDLHHNEIAELKHELFSMQDKIEYHAHERARDINEALDNCRARLATIEQHQQYYELSDDDTENPSIHLPGKLINVVLSLLALFFVILSTIQGCIKPFVKTTIRFFITLTIICIIAAMYTNATTPFNFLDTVTKTRLMFSEMFNSMINFK